MRSAQGDKDFKGRVMKLIALSLFIIAQLVSGVVFASEKAQSASKEKEKKAERYSVKGKSDAEILIPVRISSTPIRREKFSTKAVSDSARD